jgi:phenylalanine-4-hydroxylase
VMRTLYKIDDLQRLYFVVPGLQSLLDVTVSTDFAPVYRRLAAAADIGIETVLESDQTFGAASKPA